MQEIKLNLAIEDVNLILEGLGNLPFAKVFTLVGTIQGQTSEQIKSEQIKSTDQSHVEAVPMTERVASEGK